MELIYAYAENYRIFHHKEFRFSDKFRVEFDREKMKLKIERNPDYVDIYPDNIVGISAIVGKNATGKSSLLEMIGGEHFPEEMNIFMIYYLGQQESRNYFLMETSRANRYGKLLQHILSRSHGKFDASGQPLYRLFFCTSSNPQDHFQSFPPEIFGKNFIEDEILKECKIISFERSEKSDRMTTGAFKSCAELETKSVYNKLCFLSAAMASEQNEIYKMDRYRILFTVRLTSGHLPENEWDLAEERIKIPEDLKSAIQKLNQVFQSDRRYAKNIAREPSNDLITDYLVTNFLEQYLVLLIRRYFLRHLNETTISEHIYTQFVKWAEQINRHYETLEVLQKQYIQGIELLRLLPHVPQIMSGHELMDQLRKILSYASGFDLDLYGPRGNTICFAFELSSESSSIIEDADTVRLWNLLTFIRYGIFIEMDIQFLSEGEQENLSMFTSIDNQISRGGNGKYILLFDEIERCMHPEMCRTLISDLIKFLKGYPDKEFQIIIASHSPFIVGDLRKENLICLAPDHAENKSFPDSPFGQNIHTLLRSQFFLDNTLSEYAVQTINLMADCLSADSLEGMRKLIRKRLDPGGKYPWKSLPQNDHQTLPYLQRVISAIGEPMIRNSLQDELDKWKRKYRDPALIDAEIARLQDQIRVLEEAKNYRD